MTTIAVALVGQSGLTDASGGQGCHRDDCPRPGYRRCPRITESPGECGLDLRTWGDAAREAIRRSPHHGYRSPTLGPLLDAAAESGLAIDSLFVFGTDQGAGDDTCELAAAVCAFAEREHSVRHAEPLIIEGTPTDPVLVTRAVRDRLGSALADYAIERLLLLDGRGIREVRQAVILFVIAEAASRGVKLHHWEAEEQDVPDSRARPVDLQSEMALSQRRAQLRAVAISASELRSPGLLEAYLLRIAGPAPSPRMRDAVKLAARARNLRDLPLVGLRADLAPVGLDQTGLEPEGQHRTGLVEEALARIQGLDDTRARLTLGFLDLRATPDRQLDGLAVAHLLSILEHLAITLWTGLAGASATLHDVVAHVFPGHVPEFGYFEEQCLHLYGGRAQSEQRRRGREQPIIDNAEAATALLDCVRRRRTAGGLPRSCERCPVPHLQRNEGTDVQRRARRASDHKAFVANALAEVRAAEAHDVYGIGHEAVGEAIETAAGIGQGTKWERLAQRFDEVFAFRLVTDVDVVGELVMLAADVAMAPSASDSTY